MLETLSIVINIAVTILLSVAMIASMLGHGTKFGRKIVAILLVRYCIIRGLYRKMWSDCVYLKAFTQMFEKPEPEVCKALKSLSADIITMILMAMNYILIVCRPSTTITLLRFVGVVMIYNIGICCWYFIKICRWVNEIDAEAEWEASMWRWQR